MNISKKNSVIALTIASTAGTLVGFISNIVVARVLSVEDIGIFRQSMLVFNMITPMLMMGIPNALYYFLSKPDYKDEEKSILIANITLLLIPAMLFSLFLLLGGCDFFAKYFNNPALSVTLRWQILRPILSIPCAGIGAILILHNQAKLSSQYNILSNLCITIVSLAACLLTMGYMAPMLVNFFSLFFTMPILLWLVFRTASGKLTWPRLDIMKKMFLFGIPLGISRILGKMLLEIGNVIVSVMSSPEKFAIYSTGAKEVPFLPNIAGAVSTVILADMSSKCNLGDYHGALELFKKGARYLSFIMFPVTVFFILFAQDFITFLYSSKYADSVIIFQAYCLTIPFKIAPYGYGFMALGLTKSVMYRSMGSLCVGVLFCFLGIYYFGIYGAGIAVVCSAYFWEMPYNLWGLSRGFKCKAWQILPFRHLIKVALLAVILSLSCVWLLWMPIAHFWRLFWGGIIYFSLFFSISKFYFAECNEIFSMFLSKLPIRRLGK